MEYQQREEVGKEEGHDWATNQKNPMALSAADHDDFLACLVETKASHNIPRCYKHAMATDPD